MASLFKKRNVLTTPRAIIIGFFSLIIIGALLLMLPISSQSGVVTPFLDSLFTATSAVCVTGLVVLDTASHWSGFGQLIIITLIQLGGLGVVMATVLFFQLSGRKISLVQRSAMQEALASPKLSGIVKITSFIIKYTIIFELAGALLLMPTFIGQYGLEGIWMSLFHSISAFCNAGFDLMGNKTGAFSSMTSFIGNPFVNVVLILLILIGGLGFITWHDLAVNKFHFKKYSVQTKTILVSSAFLIVIPAILFFVFDFKDLSGGEKFLASLFQAVSPRTAGFNTADYASMNGAGRALTIFLMLIGGAPGSTAGGMKITTFAVLIATMISVFDKSNIITMFRRRIDDSIIRNAATILMMYLTMFLSGAMIISVVENLPMDVCLFETASAVATVGLTVGITSSLGAISRIVLILLMFFGRVGGLTLIYAAISRINSNIGKPPAAKITVG